MEKTIILDPAPACGMLPDTLLKNVDYLNPNKSELAKLIGVNRLYDGEIESACGTLIERGVQCVLASLGKDGVIIKQHDQAAVHLPAYKVKATDTTAAGDSFTAAFAYALANGKAIEESAAFANRIASVVVQRVGAQSSIPEHAEISALWDEVFMQ